MTSTYWPRRDILTADSAIICIPVNCNSAMGAGLAKTAAAKWSKLRSIHGYACKNGLLKVGQPIVINPLDPDNPVADGQPWVCLFPTKDDWRDNSQLEWVEMGMQWLMDYMRRSHIDSVAIPKLGCGLGGLNWADVHKSIMDVALDYPVHLDIYGDKPQD